MTNHPNRAAVTRVQVEALADKLDLAFGRQRIRVIENGAEVARMLWYATPTQGGYGFDPEHYGLQARTLAEMHEMLRDKLTNLEDRHGSWGPQVVDTVAG